MMKYKAVVAVVILWAMFVTQASAQQYAPHSRLSAGRWVKISVPATGFYELTDSMLRAAGFDQPQQVKVYGYGGAPQPETLQASYLTATDDLPQVPTCMMGCRRLFYAHGTVEWENNDDLERKRNPYSDKAFYFLSDIDEPPLYYADSTLFVDDHYPMPTDYHSLYEVDNFAWYHGGRNLFDSRTFGSGVARHYTLPVPPESDCTLRVAMSYNNYCEATVSVGDHKIGTILVNATTTKGTTAKAFLDSYSKAAVDTWTFNISEELCTSDSLTLTITQLSGGDMRLDHLALCFSNPFPLPDLSTALLPVPTIEETVDSQDLHADTAADMVIIIPQSGLLSQQAEQLAQLHIQHDSLRVRVVRADQIYNEFSSGTPDANAYRRYMKMLYDRAETETDKPRFLLLFGDAAFDNRLLTSDFSQLNAADLLLCYESDNSLSETNCYVTDDFFCMLDEDEGTDIIKTDKSDVAVGRLPARTAAEAQVLVDKVISYRINSSASDRQNVICFMGDDGNANMHMNDAETVASMVLEQWPSYNVKKIYWDAYPRVTVANGNRYPDVTNLVLEQMRQGALLMNYSGHGGPTLLSHELVVTLPDFAIPTTHQLPVWFTASCDVAPFDGYTHNIGETAMFNPQGGAIAFIGTTRTVYAQHNRSMNKAFTTYLLSTTDTGKPYTFGEALQQAKNDQVLGWRTSKQAGINRLHFTLLGDPALRLPLPTATVVIDSIAGVPVDDASTTVLLLAGDSATVSGHIAGHDDFNGVATLTVKDAMQTITCRMNPLDKSEMPKSPLVYNDRPITLCISSDSVRNGCFTFTFALPKDISYSDLPGQLLIHAFNDDHTLVAHGSSEQFVMGSADDYELMAEGPLITAWLDDPAFSDGDGTSTAPLFHADLYDDDGINASGSGIGHDLELIVDGQMAATYNLNSYFHFDFGSFRSGTVDYRLPALISGPHTLVFRAWDVLNHSSTLTLHFVVGTESIRSTIQHPQKATPYNSRQGFYSLDGVKVNTVSMGGVFIYRSADGKVKKMTRRRQ